MRSAGEALLSLLFEPGARPTFAVLRELAQASKEIDIAFDPGGGAGWAEVLSTGLTLEVTGLAPGAPEPCPSLRHRVNAGWPWSAETWEAVSIRPGAHVCAGDRMMPVTRAIIELGSALGGVSGAQAIVWLPTGTASPPTAFTAAIEVWRNGGSFPAACLVGLEPTPVGGLVSLGLARFTGQEMVLAPDVLATRPYPAGFAARIAAALADAGPLAEATELRGPAGATLLAEPIMGAAQVLVSHNR